MKSEKLFTYKLNTDHAHKMMRNKKAFAALLVSLVFLGIITIPNAFSLLNSSVAIGNTGSISSSKVTLAITSTAGGTTNPIPGSYSLYVGTNYQVTATPNTGYSFSHWTLDGSNAGSTNPTTVTMNANHTLLATFVQIQPPTQGIPKYGVAFHHEYQYNTGSAAVLDDLRTSGSFWTRGDCESTSETSAYWTAVKGKGIELLALIPWYHTSISGWQTAVTNMVNAIPDAPAWELGNEVEQSWWGGPISASTYYQMVQIAYPIIKAANPNATVIGPAVACNGGGISFLSSIISLGALNYLDAISVHYYPHYGQTDLNGIKNVVAGRKMLWITECGFSTMMDGNEAAQNTFVINHYNPTSGILGHDSTVQVAFYYELTDDYYPASGSDDGWGLTYGPGSYAHKQAYATFKSYLNSSAAKSESPIANSGSQADVQDAENTVSATGRDVVYIPTVAFTSSLPQTAGATAASVIEEANIMDAWIDQNIINVAVPDVSSRAHFQLTVAMIYQLE